MGTFLKAEACLVFLLVYLVLSQARTHGPPECSEKGHVTGRCKASLIRWSFHKNLDVRLLSTADVQELGTILKAARFACKDAKGVLRRRRRNSASGY
uniref:Putative secreted protein n=1 Tax=Amblyomma triste TaxID=251400 RepID=A0A023G3X0_AMBTT